MEKNFDYSQVNYKKVNIADVNSAVQSVVNISFSNDEYFPFYKEFFSKIYVLYVLTDAIDDFVKKDENGVAEIVSVSELFDFIYENNISVDDIFCNFNENYFNLAKDIFKSIDEAVEFKKTETLNNRKSTSLLETSFCNLLDTINDFTTELKGDLTSDNLNKIIGVKDEIIEALSNKDRLKERLENLENKHKTREETILKENKK